MRCVHFVQSSAYNEFLEAEVEAAKKAGVKFAYWNYLHGGREATTLANPLAIALGLEHTPYANLPWTQFLDDLITLAYRYDGLVIVVDRADLLITEKRDEMFNCLEAFLIQFHHWHDQKKPCHLCFQLAEDDHVTNLFTREAKLR
jgi:hypothetical protein